MEHLLIKAQGALIECAEPLTGIERYMLITRDQDDKYVDLLIRACLAETSDEEIKSYIHPPHRLPRPQNQPTASH